MIPTDHVELFRIGTPPMQMIVSIPMKGLVGITQIAFMGALSKPGKVHTTLTITPAQDERRENNVMTFPGGQDT